MTVIVHPFFRADGEDRTRHATTLQRAIHEMRTDLRDLCAIQNARWARRILLPR